MDLAHEVDYVGIDDAAKKYSLKYPHKTLKNYPSQDDKSNDVVSSVRSRQ